MAEVVGLVCGSETQNESSFATRRGGGDGTSGVPLAGTQLTTRSTICGATKVHSDQADVAPATKLGGPNLHQEVRERGLVEPVMKSES